MREDLPEQYPVLLLKLCHHFIIHHSSLRLLISLSIHKKLICWPNPLDLHPSTSGFANINEFAAEIASDNLKFSSIPAFCGGNRPGVMVVAG